MAQVHWKVGDPAPDFCLPDQTGQKHCLKDYRGRWVVLYFYPRDNTSGCTAEAKEFTELKPEFEKLGAVILGVSKDSVQSHQKFVAKHNLGITLLSDPEHQVLETYGAWQLKRQCGRESWGTVRSTVLIDPEGRIAHHWPRVARARGHAEKVLLKLKELLGQA